MSNPFEVIEARLSTIETLLLDIKHRPIQNNTTSSPEQLLTIEQAAEFLNLSVPTLYSKVSRGELPVMKRSKRLYFSSMELMDYLKAGHRKTSAEIKADAIDYLSNKKRLSNGK